MKEITSIWNQANGQRVFEKNGMKFTLLEVLDTSISEADLLKEIEEELDKANHERNCNSK